MFDTVTFSLNKEYFDRSSIQELFERKLKYKSLTHYTHSDSHHRYYRNWKFWLTESNLNFTGSLTNLILGNNIVNATHEDVKLALLELEEILEISLKNARVRRIDISSTLDVDYEVSRYLEIFLPPKNFKTIIYGTYETVMLVHDGVVTTKFYDKVKEDDDKYKRKLIIHKSHKLRYELHVPKNVSRFFKIENLSFGDLFEIEVYNKLIKKWHDCFLKLPVKKAYRTIGYDCSTKSGFLNSLAMNSIAALGGLEVIDVVLRKPSVNRKVRCEIRKALKQKFKNEPESQFLKEELDAKIKECYKNALRV